MPVSGAECPDSSSLCTAGRRIKEALALTHAPSPRDLGPNTDVTLAARTAILAGVSPIDRRMSRGGAEDWGNLRSWASSPADHNVKARRFSMERKARWLVLPALIAGLALGLLSSRLIDSARADGPIGPLQTGPSAATQPRLAWEHRCGAVAVDPLDPAGLQAELDRAGFGWSLVSLVHVDGAIIYCMQRPR